MLTSQFNSHPIEPLNNLSHPLEIKRINRVRIFMVIFIPVKGGIRNHYGRVPVFPKALVVGKVDAGKDRRSG